MTLNWFGISFGLLTFEKGLRFSKSLNHMVYLYVVILYAIFQIFGISRKAQKLEKKLQEQKAGT